MSDTRDHTEDRLLVLLPAAKDAERTVALFSAAAIEGIICPDLPVLCREIKGGAGVIVLTEELLFQDKSGQLAEVLRGQPEWSDVPVIVLAASPRRNLSGGNELLTITLVERPVRMATLRSVVEAALRYRRRQYQVRDMLLRLQRQAEALRSSEERFRTIFNTAQAGILVMNKDEVYVDANPAFCTILGYPWEEIVGARSESFLPRESAGLRLSRPQLMMSGRWQGEIPMRRKDGTLVCLDWRTTTLPNGNLLGVVIDVTERKAVEAALRRAQAELEEHAATLEQTVAERTGQLRQHVAQLEEFSYTVAHDLRSPLRAMQGYATAVLEDYGARIDPPGRGYLDQIINAAQRMDRLTRDVLAYSKLAREEVSLNRVDLEELVAGIAAQYPNIQAARPQIKIHSPLQPALGNEALLTQALANLLGNSVKFVAAGTQPQIEIWSEVLGARVRLWIKDNGIGISPEHQGRLFGLFERIHPRGRYEGTGVGLAIVRKALERMGGTVGVESDGRNGSRFWLELQAAGAANQD